MLTLAFRSLILAFLAIMPTLLSVALVLGLMGWLRIKLDMATALVASVALGLSVDDTFHCLLQFHRQRQAPVPATALRELPRERAGGRPLQRGRGRSALPLCGPASSSHSSISEPWSASRPPAARWATSSFSPPASPWASAGDPARSPAGSRCGRQSSVPDDRSSRPAACPRHPHPPEPIAAPRDQFADDRRGCDRRIVSLDDRETGRGARDRTVIIDLNAR